MLELLIHGLSTLALHLSDRQRSFLAERVAGLFYFVYRLSPYRTFIQTNIRAALNLSPEEADHLALRHVSELLHAIADLLCFERFAKGQVPVHWQIEGYENFQRCYNYNKGVILVSAHLGFWELFPAVLAHQGIPTTVLVQRPSVPAFDRFFVRSRAWAGVKTCYNDTVSGIRPVLRALRQGEVVAMLIDQHGENKKLLGEFFGHCVSMPEGVAYLSRHTGAWIVPVFTWRKQYSYSIQFFPGLQAQDFSTPQGLLQYLYNQIEVMIKRHPESWLWIYNRWDKYQPCPRCSPI